MSRTTLACALDKLCIRLSLLYAIAGSTAESFKDEENLPLLFSYSL